MDDDIRNEDEDTNISEDPVPSSIDGRALCFTSVKDKLRNISVEPVVFLYALSMLLTSTLITNLLLDRVRQ